MAITDLDNEALLEAFATEIEKATTEERTYAEYWQARAELLRRLSASSPQDTHRQITQARVRECEAPEHLSNGCRCAPGCPCRDAEQELAASLAYLRETEPERSDGRIQGGEDACLREWGAWRNRNAPDALDTVWYAWSAAWNAAVKWTEAQRSVGRVGAGSEQPEARKIFAYQCGKCGGLHDTGLVCPIQNVAGLGHMAGSVPHNQRKIKP